MSSGPDDGDDGGLTRAVRVASALSLVVGLVVGLALLALFGEVIAGFLLGGVLPTVLGLYGLARTGVLPWPSGGSSAEYEDLDLMEELKRRYADGEIDDDELERKLAALMEAERGGTDQSVERELDRLRR